MTCKCNSAVRVFHSGDEIIVQCLHCGKVHRFAEEAETPPKAFPWAPVILFTLAAAVVPWLCALAISFWLKGD